MPKELRVKAVSDVADAISGLRDVEGSLRGVGTAALEAAGKGKAEWAAFDAELAKANPKLKGISSAAFDAQGALDQMGKATTLGSLEASLVKSYQAVQALERKFNEAAAAGVSLGQGPRNSLETMQAAIIAGREKLDAMRASAERARVDLGLVGEAGKKAGAGVDEIGPAAKRSTDALDMLSKAGTARELSQGIRAATFELVDLKDKIEAVKSEGGVVDQRDIDRVKALDAALAKATGTVAKMADEAGDLRTKANLGAKGLEAVAGSAGSLEAMLGNLKDTAGPVGQQLADVGFKGIAVAGAFTAGHAAGTKLRELYQELTGKELPSLSSALANLITGAQNLNKAWNDQPAIVNRVMKGKQDLARAAREALSDLQKEEAGYVSLDAQRAKALDIAAKMETRLSLLTQSGKGWRAEVEANKTTYETLGTVLSALGIDYTTLGLNVRQALDHVSTFNAGLEEAERRAKLTGSGIAGLNDVLRDLPENIKDFKFDEVLSGLKKTFDSAKTAAEGLKSAANAGVVQIDGLGAAVTKARDDSSSWTMVVDDNWEALVKLRDVAARLGPDALEKFRKEILDALPAQKASALATDGMVEKLKALADVTDMLRAKQKEHRQETDRVEESFRGLRDSALDSFGALSGDLSEAAWKSIRDNAKEGKESLFTMQIMMISLKQATDEAVASFENFARGLKGFREEQIKALDVAKGWRDMLISLKENYDAGAGGLSVYLTRLNEFQTQLQVIFAGATGEAKDALKDVIDLIYEMERAAMMGGTPQSVNTKTQAQALEEAFKKAKR